MNVSIIIPTHNGKTRGFLSHAIESVLYQTYSLFELIIVDDGSSDGTRQLCEAYASDPRVTYVYQKNAGVSAARNCGIKQSSGTYVCFLDDDDVWVQDKLAKQIDFVTRLNDPQLGLCYTALELMTKEGERTGIVQSHHARGQEFFRMLCDNLVDCTSSVLVPRTALDDVGCFKEHLSHAEDYDLWLRIAKKYHIYSIDEPLVLYREHGNKLSASLEQIEFQSLLVVFNAIHDFDEIDKNTVFNQVYKNRAAYRFWRGDYDVFRRYVRFASTYGRVGGALRARYALSYFPLAVNGMRRMKKYFVRLIIFVTIGSFL